MMILVHAGDMVVVLIGLETMSLGIYSLVSSWVGKARSAEAGMKYFIMGAVASAFLIYGFALIYGLTGQTNLAGIARQAGAMAGDPVFILAMFMVLGAMAFKVALVPFHMWTPDAYEGAPTPITGFMAAGVKAAGFGILLRLLLGVFSGDFFVYGATGWINVLRWVSIVSMTVGNLAALRQNNVKRMLAYSSISHAGFIVMGVIACAHLPQVNHGPVLFYLLLYGLTTIGAFGVVAWLGSRDGERLGLENWAGLATRHPGAALAMTIFMLSLAGLPPTGGFLAKLSVFKAALGFPSLAAAGPAPSGGAQIDPQMLTLVIIAAVNSMIAIFYYLKPVVAMYFREESTSAPSPLRSGSVVAALVLAALLVLFLGLMPGAALGWASLAAMG
jgi:NADH-quinone oxidoreductase subunit N